MKSSFLIVAILLVCGFASTQAQTCSDAHTTCFNCVADVNCGWCSVSQTCLNGTTSGPTGAICDGEFSWDFDPGSCKDCTKIASCRTCLEYPDCRWCADASMSVLEGTCQRLDSGSGTCANPQKRCPCHNHIGCTDCSQDGGCAWCDRERTCFNRTNIPAELADCPLAESCVCSNVDECYECKNQNGCDWCEADSKCHNHADFVGDGACIAKATCPALCVSGQCGDKECGPHDGCGGYCGMCERDAYCTDDGFCAKFPNVAGLFLGGMFLGFGLVAVGLVGYVIYKRKTGSGGYTGLN